MNSRECETYLTVRGVQVGGRYTPYPSNQSLATRSSTFRVPSGNVATSPYANVPGGYDCYNGLYEPSAARSNYPGYPINYEDENYSGQSPAYMLPNNNDSMLSTNNIFGPPASPKTWDLFSSSTRTQHGFYSEQNPPSSGPLPSTTFSGHGLPFASHSNDVPASLSSNGTSMTGLDRILPDPTTGRIHQPAFMMGAGSSSDGLAMNSASYRNSIPWLGSDGMSASSQSSDRVMSISYGSTADGSGGSGESSASSQDTTFTYIPFSDGSPGTSMKAIVAATDLSKADCTRKSDDIGIDSRARTLSEESTPSPENNIAEGYGYSADMVVGRRSTRGSISSGMLSNGQEYTRLRPLPTPNPELYKSPQQDSADYHPQIEHRASIPSLSNSARY